MRSISVAFAALLGAAAANPMEWPRANQEYEYGYNPYPTGGSSSSSIASSSSSSSSSGYPVASSSSSSHVYPSSSSSSSQGYPVSSSSSSQSYPIYSTSSSYIYPTSTSVSFSSSGTGYVPSSTKGGDHPSYSTGVSSSKPPHPPYSTGVSSSEYPHPPLSTGYPTTEITTTYTTETICPVTKTYGTQVITTLTTSTITITSCKGGCHHQPTPPASTPIVPPPSNPSGPVYVPTTITTTTYAWVPCSTVVGHSGPSVIYSTYLTASYYPTTYVSSVIVYPTEKPQPPVVTPPAVTPPAECPAPVTVTKIITETVGQECHYCQTKTYTVTESGTKTVITVTLPPTEVPSSIVYPESATSSGKPHSEYSKPPMSTGATGTGGYPHSTGTGYIPYPTKGTSSVANSSSHVGPKPTGYGHYSW